MISCSDREYREKLGKADIPRNVPQDVRQRIEQLLSRDASERASAAFKCAPSTIGPPSVREDTLAEALPAIPFLVGMLDDFDDAEHPFSRKQTTPAEMALFALIKIGGPAVQPLTKTLDHDNPRVRQGSIEALGWIEDPSAIPTVVKSLRNDRDPKIRRACVFALHILVHGDPKRSVSRDASNDPIALEAPRDAFQDQDEGVRNSDAKAIKSIGARRKGKPSKE